MEFYGQALKNKPFTLHYADAYAGTGSHVPAVEGEQELLIPHEDFRGSVLTALNVEPGLHRYHFNDLKPEHVSELKNIRDQYPDKNISIYEQDGNEFVTRFCSGLNHNDRAVLLLDPYSTQLD